MTTDPSRTAGRFRKLWNAASSVAARAAKAEEQQLRTTAIAVGEHQLPRIFATGALCAERLSCAVPAIYVTNDTAGLPRALGVAAHPLIVLPAWVATDFDDDALAFVVGRELGRVARDPVGYVRIADAVERHAGKVTSWLRPGVTGAVNLWHRNTEMAADRAGLLCAGSVAAATRALVLLACGSKRLYDELDVDTYLLQLGDGGGATAKLLGLTSKMPSLPVRLAALRDSGMVEATVREGAASPLPATTSTRPRRAVPAKRRPRKKA